MFVRGSPRVLRFSSISLSLFLFFPQAMLNHFSLSFSLLLFSIPDQQTCCGLVRVEPKSLLMGSFGFDHRLTFLIHQCYVSFRSCPYFISPSLIYSLSYSPRSNLYRVVIDSGLSVHRRLCSDESNKKKRNESERRDEDEMLGDS